MLKIRTSIIYIVIAAIILGSVGPEVRALADETPATQTSLPVVTSPSVLDLDTAKLSQTATSFLETRETAQGVEEELKKPPAAPSTGQKLTEELYGSFQSFIVSWVFLAISAAHNRAHIQNLQLTPENQKKLAESLGQGWSANKQMFWTIPSAALQTFTKFGLTYYFEKYSELWLKSVVVEGMFKFMVSSTMFSIATNYIQGFIQVAAQAVLDHPDQFGGTTPDERGALKLLQNRAGFFYWVDGLFSKPKANQTPREKKITQTFRDIDWKVRAAMNLILFKAPELREALFSHLMTQSFLQGQNGLIYLSSFLGKLAKEKWVLDEMSWLSRNSRTIGILVASGIFASLVPSWTKDVGTEQANSRWVDLQRGYSLAKVKTLVKTMDITQKSPNAANHLEFIIQDEVQSRESRFVKYAYLMKLALDRVDSINLEKNQIIFLKTPEGRATIKAPRGSKEWAGYIYSYLMGAEFVPDAWTIWSDDKNLEYYHGMFKTAASRIIDLYSNDSKLFNTFSSMDLSAPSRARLAIEQRNFLQMEAFMNYLSQALEQQWTTKTPTTTYYPARALLEQIAFWGVHESDIIQTIVDGSVSTH